MKKYIAYLILISAVMMFLAGCNEKETQQLENLEEVLETKSEVNEGDFIYRLVTEKAEYIEGEPIKIYAELEYIGDQEKIEISHAASPFYFPIVEKTRDFQIGYPMNEPLVTTTLIKGQPLREDYKGSGGYSSEDEAEYVNFMKQIIKNEFPVGQYEVNGVADFFVIKNEETKEKKAYKIEAAIEFKVNSTK